MDILRDWGYGGVVILMAMESSIFPVPSELVIPPAAYWASQGKMSFVGVVLAGTFGSWLGSAITYGVSAAVGRPFLKRYGKYVLISPKKLELAEGWVQEYGTAGVFFARLLPVIRHLISIPAGICHMNFVKFSIVTTVGAFIWCAILAAFGPNMITPGMFENPDMMAKEIKHQMHWIVGLIALVAVLYAVMMVFAKRNKTNRKPATES